LCFCPSRLEVKAEARSFDVWQQAWRVWLFLRVPSCPLWLLPLFSICEQPLGREEVQRRCDRRRDAYLPEYQAHGIIRHMEAAKVGKRGAIIVPARLRKRFGIEEGSIVTAEEKDDGILIRPAVIVPVERYTPERKAEFLLSNAVDEADYRRARKAVRKLGLDPDRVRHRRPR